MTLSRLTRGGSGAWRSAGWGRRSTPREAPVRSSGSIPGGSSASASRTWTSTRTSSSRVSATSAEGARGWPHEGVPMNDPGGTRVAVYIDFDNIVISRYDQVHGRSQFQRDKVRGFSQGDRTAEPEVAYKIGRAAVDVGAHIHFASSF